MQTMIPTLDAEVEKVLNAESFDFRDPLQTAWRWNRSKLPDELRKAEQLLGVLSAKHANALPVWYELAFNLVCQKRRDEALSLLRDKIEPRLGHVFDEDMHGLYGRCLKDQGDEHLAAGRLAAAEEAYAEAEVCYERAYGLGKDRFPGINVATLRLLRASLMRQFSALPAAAGTQDRDESETAELKAAKLVASSQERARQVLASRPIWQPLLNDDEIWMAATEAEALVLIKEWAKACEKYKAALRKENAPLPHHPHSMATQLLRLKNAYDRLNDPMPPPLSEPERFFQTLFPASG